MCQGCVKGMARVCQGCVKGVSRVCQGRVKGVPRVCQGCAKGVSRVCQGCVKGVSRVCQGSTCFVMTRVAAVFSEALIWGTGEMKISGLCKYEIMRVWAL